MNSTEPYHILNQDQSSIITITNAIIAILGIIAVCLKKVNESGFTWNSKCMEINKVEPRVKHRRRSRSLDLESGDLKEVIKKVDTNDEPRPLRALASSEAGIRDDRDSGPGSEEVKK